VLRSERELLGDFASLRETIRGNPCKSVAKLRRTEAPPTFAAIGEIRGCQILRLCVFARNHPCSMLDVQRSMFDVRLSGFPSSFIPKKGRGSHGALRPHPSSFSSGRWIEAVLSGVNYDDKENPVKLQHQQSPNRHCETHPVG